MYQNNGFTLIEMLLVLSIIITLSTLAFPYMKKQTAYISNESIQKQILMIIDQAKSQAIISHEKIILNIMKHLAKDKIVIFITHRMAHCKESQLTFVMKEGRLIQQGSYEELFKQANLFRELVENQKNLERIIENER